MPPDPETELEFAPDSLEWVAYTIDYIGYRDKLDQAFQAAIARASSVLNSYEKHDWDALNSACLH